MSYVFFSFSHFYQLLYAFGAPLVEGWTISPYQDLLPFSQKRKSLWIKQLINHFQLLFYLPLMPYHLFGVFFGVFGGVLASSIFGVFAGVLGSSIWFLSSFEFFIWLLKLQVKQKGKVRKLLLQEFEKTHTSSFSYKSCVILTKFTNSQEKLLVMGPKACTA